MPWEGTLRVREEVWKGREAGMNQTRKRRGREDPVQLLARCMLVDKSLSLDLSFPTWPVGTFLPLWRCKAAAMI